MGLIKAATDSLGGTLADQWLDLITAGYFDEHTVVAPGVLKSTNNGRGSNLLGSQGVISNGSKIFVPENTVAYIFSQGGIETVVSIRIPRRRIQCLQRRQLGFALPTAGRPILPWRNQLIRKAHSIRESSRDSRHQIRHQRPTGLQ